MGYNLFLDDVREVSSIYQNLNDESFVVVRNYTDFVTVIKERGLPDFISFDNDLGIDKFGEIDLDGYAAAKWLVFDSGLDLSNLKYFVHSANPVASQQIKSLLDNYIRYLNGTV